MKNLIKSRKGLTLIELLVGMVIFALVLVIGINFVIYARNNTSSGMEKSDVGQNVGFAANAISKELMYATHVRIFETFPDVETDGLPQNVFTAGDGPLFNFIYSDSQGRVMFREVIDGVAKPAVPIFVPAGKVDDMKLAVTFNYDKIPPTLVHFEVTNTNDDYSIKGIVTFLNLLKGWDPSNTNQGIAVAYRTNLITLVRDIASAIEGQPYNHNMKTVGGNPPYKYALTSGNLPLGLELKEQGIIQGTPLESGIFVFTIEVTDKLGMKDSFIFTLDVEPKPLPLVLDPTEPPGGMVGIEYPGHSFGITGGNEPYTFSVSAGSLPDGLIMNSSGVISGTPLTAGDYDFTIRVVDDNGDSVEHNYLITIEPAIEPLVLDPVNPPDGIAGDPYPAFGFDVSGGVGPYVFNVNTGSLPAGLSMNESGEISGAPLFPGTYVFEIRVQDSTGEFVIHEYTINVLPAVLVINYEELPPGITGEEYSGYTFSADGGIGPYTYALISGSLPTGLLMSEGTISGIPTTEGLYEFTVEVTDSTGIKAAAGFSITINKGSGPSDFANFILDENVFVYGTALSFAGGNVIGPNATMVIGGDIKTPDTNMDANISVSNIYIDGILEFDGGSASFGSQSAPGNIHVNGDLTLWNGTRNIYGDIYVDGDFMLKDARIHGIVYVNGDVTLGWTPWLSPDSRIYYTGSLTHPYNRKKDIENIVNKCISQSSVPLATFPEHDIPEMREDDFFTSRGYVSGGALSNGIKIFADSYTKTNWTPMMEDVIIVAKNGDITLTGFGGSGIKGVFYAPKGKVTFNGGSLEGLVIARDGFFVTSGGTTVTFKSIDHYISDPDDYPF